MRRDRTRNLLNIRLQVRITDFSNNSNLPHQILQALMTLIVIDVTKRRCSHTIKHDEGEEKLPSRACPASAADLIDKGEGG